MPSQFILIHFTLKTETLISIFSISKKKLAALGTIFAHFALEYLRSHTHIHKQRRWGQTYLNVLNKKKTCENSLKMLQKHTSTPEWR